MTVSDFRLSDFLPYRLAVLSERVSRRLSVEYGRTLGLTLAEWRVLVHLLGPERASVRDIHAAVNLEKPRVSRAVSRLVTAGLVRKTVDEGDARLVSIALTYDGREALNEILPKALEVERNLLSALSIEEQQHLYAIMEKLHAALDADEEARPRPVSL